MKLQIMSDAHMQVDCGFGHEYGKFNFPAVAPNLVLLGGMGRICDTELQDFIVLQLTRFERVFYVMGMDEFHQSTVTAGRQEMQKFTKSLAENPPTSLPSGETIDKLGVFHYLHRTRVDVEDITILGCTLWRGWKENSNQTRGRASAAYRPIKDFYAEEETVERELDLAWLQSQLEACANGEAAVSVPSGNDVTEAPPEQPPVADSTAESVDEGDIYDDVEMSPPTKEIDLPGDQPSENVPPVAQALPSSEPIPDTTPHPVKRQGPPRRVVILTAHPPTFQGTTAPGIGPVRMEQTEEAVVVLQGRQCWAQENGCNNGVVVNSSLHGNDDPRPQKGDIMRAEVDQQADTKASEAPPCGHDIGFTGDPHRPAGVALWMFGYTEWSCDTGYETPVTTPTFDNPKGKKRDVTGQPANKNNRCLQCGRVPVSIRMISNQRGQQWRRNPVPYVNVPPTWRAFDEAFVVDV